MRRHWIYKYLGKPFIAGEYDCGTLVSEIMENEFGKTTILIDNNRDTTLERQRHLAFWLSKYVEEIDSPINGCVACMSYGGRTRHIGVYYVYNGLGNVIHVGAKTSGVMTCRVNRLATQGLRVINYVQFHNII